MKNRLKVLGIVAAVAIIGLSVTSCDSGNGDRGLDSELFGRWVSGSETWVFHSNGTLTSIVGQSESLGSWNASRGVLTISLGDYQESATYTISGNLLTINWGGGSNPETWQRVPL